jgi:hypothetical protein
MLVTQRGSGAGLVILQESVPPCLHRTLPRRPTVGGLSSERLERDAPHEALPPPVRSIGQVSSHDLLPYFAAEKRTRERDGAHCVTV